jgi:tetratricopeptide (TPR) repeat protein
LKEDGKMPATDLQQEIESSTARMHMRLGDRIRQRGRERAAVAEYRRALDKDPYSPYLLNKLAGTLISQGQFEPALQHLERARVLEPDYVTTYTHLGRLHVAQQNFAQARLALEEAIQLNPFDPSIHQYLADIYRRLDLQDKARQEQDVLKRLQETP